jgi:hypothetical protein
MVIEFVFDHHIKGNQNNSMANLLVAMNC